MTICESPMCERFGVSASELCEECKALPKHEAKPPADGNGIDYKGLCNPTNEEMDAYEETLCGEYGQEVA